MSNAESKSGRSGGLGSKGLEEFGSGWDWGGRRGWGRGGVGVRGVRVGGIGVREVGIGGVGVWEVGIGGVGVKEVGNVINPPDPDSFDPKSPPDPNSPDLNFPNPNLNSS